MLIHNTDFNLSSTCLSIELVHAYTRTKSFIRQILFTHHIFLQGMSGMNGMGGGGGMGGSFGMKKNTFGGQGGYPGSQKWGGGGMGGMNGKMSSRGGSGRPFRGGRR
jgi:hypothetical protein